MILSYKKSVGNPITDANMMRMIKIFLVTIDFSQITCNRNVNLNTNHLFFTPAYFKQETILISGGFMKKKFIPILLASTLAVSLLSACGSDHADGNTKNSKTETSETISDTAKTDSSSSPVSVTLNEVAHSIFYAPMYVAIENGYFEDEGIKLTLVTGFGADKTMTAVLSGEADIGFMGSESSIYNEGANDHVENFAQLTQRAGNFLVAREEMPDFDWDDLKGKNVLGGRKGGVHILM